MPNTGPADSKLFVMSHMFIRHASSNEIVSELFHLLHLDVQTLEDKTDYFIIRFGLLIQLLLPEVTLMPDSGLLFLSGVFPAEPNNYV